MPPAKASFGEDGLAGGGGEPRLEEPQVGWFEGEGEAARDVVAVLVDVDEAVRDEVDVAASVDASRDGETEEFQRGKAVLPGAWIAARGDAAAFDAADARVDVDRRGQGLAGELGAGDVWQRGGGVHTYAVATDVTGDRHALGAQASAEVFDLCDPGTDVGLVDGLGDALRDGLHVASGHAAVGVQAIVEQGEPTCLVGEFGIA